MCWYAYAHCRAHTHTYYVHTTGFYPWQLSNLFVFMTMWILWLWQAALLHPLHISIIMLCTLEGEVISTCVVYYYRITTCDKSMQCSMAQHWNLGCTVYYTLVGKAQCMHVLQTPMSKLICLKTVEIAPLFLIDEWRKSPLFSRCCSPINVGYWLRWHICLFHFILLLQI